MKDFKVVSKRGKLYNVIEMNGLDDLVKDLHEMAGEMVAEEGKDVVAQVVKPISRRMEAKVPVDTGLMKDFLRTTKGKRTRTGVEAAALAGFPYKRTAGGAKRPGYAIQLEYGTENTREQPFIRPAFDGHEKDITDDVMRRLKLKVIKWRFRKTVKPPIPEVV